MWTYRATVARVVDADTLDADIDLGFGITKRERLRLARIDAWEVRGEERERGLAAKAWVVSRLLQADNRVIVRTSKRKGKYGRYVAEVYPADGDWYAEAVTALDLHSLSDLLVTAGHAEYREY